MIKQIALVLIIASTLQACGTYRLNGQVINGRPQPVSGLDLKHNEGDSNTPDDHHHHNHNNKIWGWLIVSTMLYYVSLERSANKAERALYAY